MSTLLGKFSTRISQFVSDFLKMSVFLCTALGLLTWAEQFEQTSYFACVFLTLLAVVTVCCEVRAMRQDRAVP